MKSNLVSARDIVLTGFIITVYPLPSAHKGKLTNNGPLYFKALMEAWFGIAWS